MRQRPLYWTSLALASGMAGSHAFIHHEIEGRWWMLLLLVLLSIYPLLGQQWKTRIWLLAAAGIGFCYYSFFDQSNQSTLLSVREEVQIEGEIISSAIIDGDRVKFRFQVEKVNGSPLTELVECYVPLKTQNEQTEAKKLKAGSHLHFSTQIISPQPARNAGTFDYKKYLYYKRIHWIARPKSFSLLEITPPSRYHPAYLLEKIQSFLSDSIERSFPVEAADLMKGVLIGIRQDIPVETMDAYSKLGFIHVLAISGLHMTVLVGGLLAVLRGLGFTRETSIITTIGFVPIYVILVGASPSVVRSGIMAVTVLLGHYLNRPRDGLNLWGAALLFMIICNPYQLWDIGFQLSFAVTWGLLVLSTPLQKEIPISSEPLASLISVTIAAQLISFPMTIYYFHQYHLLSFLINLLFVPVYSFIITPLGFIGLLLGLIHPALALIPAHIISFLLYWINGTLERAALGTILLFYVSSPPIWWIVLYGLTLICRISLRVRIFGLSLLFVILPILTYQGEKVIVTFLDVGQGDAIVIEAPGDRVYLIDGGGTAFLPMKQEAWRKRNDPFEPGKKVILPFLKSKGINEIDLLIMTHGDMDHIGGLAAVIKEMKVKQVLWNGRPSDSLAEKELLDSIKDYGIPSLIGSSGLKWEDHPQVKWSVLHPSPRFSGTDNNQSLVLLLEPFGKKILFTGDLEKQGELEVLKQDHVPKIDILKVGHHGSRTSTDDNWVQRLRPSLSIISVGEHNRFGHPHQETLETLERAGSEILRTDQSGAVILEFSRNNMEVKTYLQPLEK